MRLYLNFHPPLFALVALLCCTVTNIAHGLKITKLLEPDKPKGYQQCLDFARRQSHLDPNDLQKLAVSFCRPAIDHVPAEVTQKYKDFCKDVKLSVAQEFTIDDWDPARFCTKVMGNFKNFGPRA